MVDARHPGHLDPPVVGTFQDGVGTFYADDTFRGKTDPHALYLVAHRHGLAALGTGLLAGRRQRLGIQLDDGFHKGAMTVAFARLLIGA